MTQQNIANHYQRHRARGASPVGLVVLLYDAAIESLRRAKLAAESGRIEQRVAASNHVLLVINELGRSLDPEPGGEAARHLLVDDTVVDRARSRGDAMTRHRCRVPLFRQRSQLLAMWIGVFDSP